MKMQNEWNVDDMTWFTGCESERKPPHPHNLTFLLPSSANNNNNDGGASTSHRKSPKPPKKVKWTGYCVSFKDETMCHWWLNSVIICKQEYLSNSMPLIQI